MEQRERMDWNRSEEESNRSQEKNNRIRTGQEGPTNSDDDDDDDDDESVRPSIKRSRITYSKLPVIGHHLVLVGPRHLIQPFATTCLQVASSLDDGKTHGDLAVQPLQQSIPNATPTDQRYVHMFETLTDNLPQPCHVVMVTECTPQVFVRGLLHEISSIQTALEPLREKLCSSSLDWARQVSMSLLVCLTSTATATIVDAKLVNNQTQWLLQGSGMSVFTCHDLESSRQTVARMLWKRCALTLRQHSSPLAVARFSTTAASLSL